MVKLVPKDDESKGVTIPLKKCPFCGKNVVELNVIEEDGVEYFQMYCPIENGGCGSTTGFYDDPRGAIDAWNMRSKEDDCD